MKIKRFSIVYRNVVTIAHPDLSPLFALCSRHGWGNRGELRYRRTCRDIRARAVAVRGRTMAFASLCHTRDTSPLVESVVESPSRLTTSSHVPFVSRVRLERASRLPNSPRLSRTKFSSLIISVNSYSVYVDFSIDAISSRCLEFGSKSKHVRYIQIRLIY